MSRSILGVAVMEGQVRPVPKHLLTLEETEFALGSGQLVKDLKAIGALVSSKNYGRVQLYPAEHVREVCERWENGEFDDALSKLPGGQKKVWPLRLESSPE